MSGKFTKTNALRVLEEAEIKYSPHFYLSEAALDGVRVAELINVNPRRVFKTLVTQGKSLAVYVFIIPVDSDLDLKRAASLAGEKSLSMIPANQLLSVTGYVRGGCSPVGMKKRYPTFIDASALESSTMVVSAGRIGMQMELSPEALRDITDAHFESLTTRDAAFLARAKTD